jgi:hypothetical protein
MTGPPPPAADLPLTAAQADDLAAVHARLLAAGLHPAGALRVAGAPRLRWADAAGVLELGLAELSALRAALDRGEDRPWLRYLAPEGAAAPRPAPPEAP